MSVGNVLVGLREGMETCLLLTILTALLVRGNRRSWVVLVRVGSGCAVIVAVVFGWLLAYSNSFLDATGRAVFEAATSAVAVVFVSGMIFWMRHPPDTTAAELNGKLARVLRIGPAAAFVVSFVAVLKEGIEGTTFVLVASQQSGVAPVGPLLSLLVGVAIGASLTWLLYRHAIHLNMTTFFTVTSFLLVSVGAGVLGEGLRALQDAGILPGGHLFAFDIGSILPDRSWYGSLITGILNISSRPTMLQAVAWASYWAVVASLLVRAMRRPVTTAADEPSLVATETT